MKVVCPNCHYAGRLVEFTNEAEAREFMRLAFKTPAPLAELLIKYMQLFRPAKQALRWDRAVKLLEPLVKDLSTGYISRHGRDWAAPQSIWPAALQTVIGRRDSLSLPLKDHSYLYEVLSRQANTAEAKREEQVEQQRKTGQHRASGPRHVKGELEQLVDNMSAQHTDGYRVGDNHDLNPD